MGLQSPLAKRLIFSALLISFCVYLVFFAPFFLFFIGVVTVILLTLNEFFSLVEKKGLPVHRTLGLIFGALVPFNYFFPAEPLFVLLAILALFVVGFDRNSPLTSNTLTLAAITFFGVIYIAWLGSFFLKLRQIPDTGPLWILFVVFIAKMGDAGAYFIGKLWGRHKLIKHVSPGKSVEGAISSFVITLACALLSKIYLSHVPMMHLFILGICVSILAQLGDLAESLIKRNLDAKDSGKIPGLGGMLDVMDSLLFSVPFVYFYVMNVPGVNS